MDQHRIDKRFVAPNRLARVVGDDFSHNAHRRQNQNVNFRMAEEPKQMLPQQRAAAAADVRQMSSNCQARRQKETRARQVVHQLQDARGFERRKRQQQQERGHELRPDKKWHPHPRHAWCAQLNDGGDEIHRAQQGRRDEQHHADEPERLAMRRNRGRQWRIGSPARLRRAARNEKAHQHHDAAEDVSLITRHVHTRKCHVRRANHQRHHVIAERRERQRHHAEENHDGAVHRAERIVKVRRNRAVARHRRPQNFFQQRADKRHRRARMRNLPAHQQHQEKAKQQKAQSREPVLNADNLVVGGKNIAAPETGLVMTGVLAVAVLIITVRRELVQELSHSSPGK